MTAIDGKGSARAGPGTATRSLPAAEVRAHALVTMTREEIAAFRKHPDPLPAGWPLVPPSTLRHSDEQTIAAVAAFSGALGFMGIEEREHFEEWGILVAPRFPGRVALAENLSRFRSEGVWGVSPNLIPHHALHSPAGTLSLVLGTHGPNMSIGGGLHAATEGILAAQTWLAAGTASGVWLVLTCWIPELRPEPEAMPALSAECHALALALVPARGLASPRWTVGLGSTSSLESPSPLDLLTLAGHLTDNETHAPTRRRATHHAHGGSSIPRPHLMRNDSAGTYLRILAVDSTGRRRVELRRS